MYFKCWLKDKHAVDSPISTRIDRKGFWDGKYVHDIGR